MNDVVPVARYANYIDFRRHSTFRLKEGGLYQVDAPVTGLGGCHIRLYSEDLTWLDIPNGEYLLCLGKPYKHTIERLYNHTIESGSITQYWAVKFLTREKVLSFLADKSPMDLARFNYKLNLKLLQVR